MPPQFYVCFAPNVGRYARNPIFPKADIIKATPPHDSKVTM